MRPELETSIEFNLNKMKLHLGHLGQDMFEGSWYGDTQVTADIVIKSLQALEFIERDTINSMGYHVTGKGWLFESFEKEREKIKRQDDLIKSTGTFYEHQKKINKGQIGLGFAVLLSSIVSAAAATYTYNHTVAQDQNKVADNRDHKIEIQRLKDSIKTLREYDTRLFRQIKDSLKIP